MASICSTQSCPSTAEEGSATRVGACKAAASQPPVNRQSGATSTRVGKYSSAWQASGSFWSLATRTNFMSFTVKAPTCCDTGVGTVLLFDTMIVGRASLDSLVPARICRSGREELRSDFVGLRYLRWTERRVTGTTHADKTSYYSNWIGGPAVLITGEPASYYSNQLLASYYSTVAFLLQRPAVVIGGLRLGLQALAVIKLLSSGFLLSS